MVDRKFLEGLGLTEEQVSVIGDALDRESRYRRILLDERVSPGVVELIIRTTDLNEIDLSDEPLLREKVRAEWEQFISQDKPESKGGKAWTIPLRRI